MNINIWKEKIKQKRKTTSFRDFLFQIASWLPINYHNVDWLVSRYPKSDRAKICDFREFEIERDSFVEKWLDYDFSKDFFNNFFDLFKTIKLPNLLQYYENENSDYADIVASCKNCYLSTVIINDCENVFYSLIVRKLCRNVFYSMFINNNSENIYLSRDVAESFNIFYSAYIRNSSNIWFSSNLIWCTNCIFCNNLENASYCINNKKYDKKDFLKEKENILKRKDEFIDFYKNIKEVGNNINSINVKGSSIEQSLDIENGYYVSNMKNARNVVFVWSAEWNENFYDIFNAWSMWGNDFYAIQWAWTGSSSLYCSVQIWFSTNIFYSYHLESCSYCIWCIWLRNKSYCILNKQYNKMDWEDLAEKIFSQMDKDWILWDFFPWSLNPIYFEDSVAWMLWGFSYEEIKNAWFLSKQDDKSKNKEKENYIESFLLNNYEWYDKSWNWFIKKDLIWKNILDEKWNYYKLILDEYNFLIKYSLPLPRYSYKELMKINLWIK